MPGSHPPFLVSAQLAEKLAGASQRRLDVEGRERTARAALNVEAARRNIVRAVVSVLSGLAASRRIRARRGGQFPTQVDVLKDGRFPPKVEERLAESLSLRLDRKTRSILQELGAELSEQLERLHTLEIGRSATLVGDEGCNAHLQIFELPLDDWANNADVAIPVETSPNRVVAKI